MILDRNPLRDVLESALGQQDSQSLPLNQLRLECWEKVTIKNSKTKNQKDRNVERIATHKPWVVSTVGIKSSWFRD